MNSNLKIALIIFWLFSFIFVSHGQNEDEKTGRFKQKFIIEGGSGYTTSLFFKNNEIFQFNSIKIGSQWKTKFGENINAIITVPWIAVDFQRNSNYLTHRFFLSGIEFAGFLPSKRERDFKFSSFMGMSPYIQRYKSKYDIMLPGMKFLGGFSLHYKERVYIKSEISVDYTLIFTISANSLIKFGFWI